MLKHLRIGLLPGLDGTGELFDSFVRALPAQLTTKVVSYPRDAILSLLQLTECAHTQLIDFEPDVILAESFSGPIAFRLAAERMPATKLVILVASFVTCPRPIVLAVASVLPLRTLVRLPIPDSTLRTFAFDETAAVETLTAFRKVLSGVSPKVLAARFRLLARLTQPEKVVETPCVLLQPSADRLVPTECRQSLSRCCSDLDVQQIDGPHFILQARPVAAARAVVQVLEQRFGGEYGDPGIR